MFKDTDQELARLEAELLKEELAEEEYEEEYDEVYDEEYESYEDAEEDLPPEYYYTDTRSADGPAVYQNYSNGYHVYNTDELDEDLDAFSEEVYEDEPTNSYTGLIVICCLLAVTAVAGALFLLLKYRGIL